MESERSDLGLDRTARLAFEELEREIRDGLTVNYDTGLEDVLRRSQQRKTPRWWRGRVWAPQPHSQSLKEHRQNRPWSSRHRVLATLGVVFLAAALTLGTATTIVLFMADFGQAPIQGYPARNRPSPVQPSLLPAPIQPVTHRSTAGAKQFVEYWFETLNYATQTGDTAPLRAASDPGCVACADAVERVRNSYSNGGWLQGGTFAVRAVQINGHWRPDRMVLHVMVDRSSRTGVEPNGDIRHLPAAIGRGSRVTIQWKGDSWTVTAVAGDDLIP